MFNDRGNNRAWGTRFSLLSTNSSSTTPAPLSVCPSPVSSTISANFTDDNTVSVTDWSAQPPQPSPVFAPPTSHSLVPNPIVHPHVSSQQLQYPHDASVFVASLPSHMSESDLRNALANFFGTYRPVKHVKIIGPDSRNAVCAFIQAYTSEDAAAFIERFHLATFHHRTIRCERARALRTLFVSFKMPTGPTRLTRLGRDVGLNPAAPHLPSSIRLRRSREARHVDVLFDAEADAFDVANPDNHASFPQPAEPLSHAGVYIAPLTYDTQTLRSLCAAFGPLDVFRPAQIPADMRPMPHNTPVNEMQSSEVMEVKWEYRNDAVSAHNVLAEIPFMAVSWAHNHPFHPDAVPPRPSFIAGRFAPRHVPENIETNPSSRNTSAPMTPMLAPLSFDLQSAHGPRLTRGPQFAPITHANPVSNALSTVNASGAPTHGTVLMSSNFAITERDFPPLSNMPGGSRVRHLDNISAWTKPVSSLVEHVQTVQDDLLAHVPSRSPTPVLSPTDSGTDNAQSVPETPVTAEFSFEAVHDDRNQYQEDPYTLFVGGIAMNRPPMWDEDRIREFYEVYGKIENVRFVRPAMKPVAFAFVRFANTTSTYRAIADHVNRDHEGQQIKVRVKDSMPFRPNWQSRQRGGGAPLRGRSLSRRFAQTGEAEVDEQDDAAVKSVVMPAAEMSPTPDVEEVATPAAEVESQDIFSSSPRSPPLEKDIIDEKAPVVKIAGIGLGTTVGVTHMRSVSQSTTSSTDVETTDVDSVPAPSDSETDVDTSFASLIVHDISVAAVEPTSPAIEAAPSTTDDETPAATAPVVSNVETSEPAVDTPRPQAQLPATTSKPVDVPVSDTASASGLPQPQFSAPPFYYPYAVPPMPYFPGTPQRPNAAPSDKSANASASTHAQSLGTPADQQQQQHWSQHMPMQHAPYGIPSIIYDHNGLAVPVPWVPATQAAMYYPQMHGRPDMQQHPAQGAENPPPQAQHSNPVWAPAFYPYPPQMWFGGVAGQNGGGDGTFGGGSHQHQDQQHGGAGVNSYAVPFKVVRNPMGGPMNTPGPVGTGRNDKNANVNFSINPHAPMFRASGPGTPVSPTHPHMPTYPSLNVGDGAWTAPYMHDQTTNPHAFAPYHAVMMHHPAAAQMQHVPGGRYGGNAGPPPQQW